MSERYVDIDGARLLFYLNRKIDSLERLAKEEEERWERYTHMRMEYFALSLLKRLFAPRPKDDDGDDLIQTYWTKDDQAYQRALRSARRMATGIHPDLTYHLDKSTAEWMEFGA
jgi:hypothetical protein